MPSTRPRVRATLAGVPAEVLWHVPSPAILLMGCTPFDATPRPGPCPTCGDRVSDRPDMTGGERPTVVYCLRCDRMDDRHAAALARQRCESEVSRVATDDAEREQRDLGHAKEGLKGITLSEAHRRRIWLGYRSSPLAKAAPSCLAAAGQAWLKEIGQLPDWSLVLDGRGRVVGRAVDGPPDPEGQPL